MISYVEFISNTYNERVIIRVPVTLELMGTTRNRVRHGVAAMRATTPVARFMGPTWGPSGADRTQVGPMLAPWTLLSGNENTSSLNYWNPRVVIMPTLLPMVAPTAFITSHAFIDVNVGIKSSRFSVIISTEMFRRFCYILFCCRYVSYINGLLLKCYG